MAAIAGPIIKMGTALFGGLQSRSAINNAVRDLLTSYGRAGEIAYDKVTNIVNPQLFENAQRWETNVIGSANEARHAANLAAERGMADVNTAVVGGQAGVNEAVAGGQAGVQPYMTAGGGALETLANLLQKPQQYQYQADPGYQFRLAEGNKAIQRLGAAQGASGGGGMTKALAQYNSGLASQEYGAGFNRFMQQQQQRQSGLTNLATMGQRAGEYAGELGLRGSTFNAGLGTQGAQFNAGLGTRAAEYGGNAAMGAQRWAGDLWSHTTDRITQNNLDLANMLANLEIQGGRARAGGQMARAGVWNDVLTQMGGAATSLPWDKWFKTTPSASGPG